MVINFNFPNSDYCYFMVERQHELLSGRKVYNGMMSIELGGELRKGSEEGKHLGSALRDETLTDGVGALEACQTDSDN